MPQFKPLNQETPPCILALCGANDENQPRARIRPTWKKIESYSRRIYLFIFNVDGPGVIDTRRKVNNLIIWVDGIRFRQRSALPVLAIALPSSLPDLSFPVTCLLSLGNTLPHSQPLSHENQAENSSRGEKIRRRGLVAYISGFRGGTPLYIDLRMLQAVFWSCAITCRVADSGFQSIDISPATGTTLESPRRSARM